MSVDSLIVIGLICGIVTKLIGQKKNIDTFGSFVIGARGTSYTARNITSARATTEERPDEEARWTSTTWWRLPTSPSS
jgi:uncharacterized membrane protein YeaQ/YmgE (transglycosylase-associated protein family)